MKFKHALIAFTLFISQIIFSQEDKKITLELRTERSYKYTVTVLKVNWEDTLFQEIETSKFRKKKEYTLVSGEFNLLIFKNDSLTKYLFISNEIEKSLFWTIQVSDNNQSYMTFIDEAGKYFFKPFDHNYPPDLIRKYLDLLEKYYYKK
jgi:hypothetical protein